jgi:glycosyltransferase involved in cell wall biosynthesis
VPTLTDREGSLLAMIEAAAYGLPRIASDHPGNRTYVERSRAIAERYSWQRIAERYDAFFQKVLRAKSS